MLPGKSWNFIFFFKTLVKYDVWIRIILEFRLTAGVIVENSNLEIKLQILL